MRGLRRGLSRIYGTLADFNHRRYDQGLKSSVQLKVPVISIGNLTVGGTGKTPITSFCLSLLLEKGHRPGLVVRSYRASTKEPAPVRLTGARPASEFGDEAVWYARRHPHLPIWSGPRKFETAQALCAREEVDVVLLDDGYQHRALARDLNLLLLDSTDALSAYEPLPLGRARESFAGIQRADAILWTKANLGTAPQLPLPAGAPVFHFDSALGGEPLSEPVLTVSGIARPESFSALIESKFPGLPQTPMDFRDHHPYDSRDVKRILERARSLGVRKVVTTEKDEVKLRPLWTETSITLLALPLEVRLRESVESFYELLRQPLDQRA